ncbi:MAG: hypothetical protein ACLP59_10900 [Bryobacteraceae bacterium]
MVRYGGPVRVADNTLQITSYSEVTGDYYNDWYLQGDSSFYFNGTLEETSGWQQSSVTGGEFDFKTTIPLQTYGTGQYYQSFLANALSYDCPGYGSGINFVQECENLGLCTGGTASANFVNLSRPYISNVDAPPEYLGGALTAGTYSEQATIISDGEGATGSPVYTLWTNPGGATGTLSCTNCVSPVYTATGGSACNVYDITIMVSYGGFEGYFWIENKWPASMQTMYTVQNYGNWPAAPNEGWGTENVNKVFDSCGGPMNWVPVNEKFTSARDLYPGGSNWGFPNPFGDVGWVPGVWKGSQQTPAPVRGTGEFDEYGDFGDFIFQNTVMCIPGCIQANPVPLVNGGNGYSETPAATVTTFGQQFYAVGTVSGQGMLIHTGTQTHYIDHGKGQ